MRTLPLLAAVLLAASCGEDPYASDPTTAPMRTDQAEYTITRTGIGYRVDIPFRFVNTAERTVYVVNCNRHVPPLLEKQVNGEWVVAYASVVPLCLSEPIVIEPGGAYEDTLQIHAGYPDSNYFPKFEVAELEGTYRLVWTDVLWSFDANSYPFGPEVPRPLRTSNTFTLTLDP